MVKVFLREKKLKNGKRGLYLDFYPPVKHPETHKETRREHLRLYVYERPKTETEREHNKETKMLGENIKSKRQLDLQAGVYGFISARDRRADFLAFFTQVVESKNRTSVANHYVWKAALYQFENFTNKKCRFGDVTEKLCAEYKNYLLDKFAINSAASYFLKFRSVAESATQQNLFSANPARKFTIGPEETHKEFLSLEELQKLADTPFKYEDLRRAALFSALTGLRFSDIAKLTWQEVQHSESQGFYIRFKQQKTKYLETLPISRDAFELLGVRGEPDEKVFKELKKAQCMYLPIWTAKANIDKEISFHSFRHTFATLQLTLGTDLYTVSKLLGHRDIKTTQIYAKIIDSKKRTAADLIKLK
ncbi:MAG: site-specific integrase [Acidobacteria bacterium]|jgi:site-specific recombinase XerD|nr:site-specific integrase [Acidobacteriota bacterium]